MSVSFAVFGGRGGVAPPLFDAVYGVHVYLHVLARLEGLAAHGAGVGQPVGGVHVEQVLLEVAIVAVELAALGARGLEGRLTVSVRGAARGVGVALLRLSAGLALAARRPGRSWGRRGLVQCSLLAPHPTSLASPSLSYPLSLSICIPTTLSNFHCC